VVVDPAAAGPAAEDAAESVPAASQPSFRRLPAPPLRPRAPTHISLAEARRTQPPRGLAGWRFSAAVVAAVIIGGSISWLLTGSPPPPPAPRLASSPAATPDIDSRAVIEPMPQAVPDADQVFQGGESARTQGRLPRTERGIIQARRKALELNRQALAAYNDGLDPTAAQRILEDALRRSEILGPRGLDLVARTHVNLAVVLAGGFKQREAASVHFREAQTIDPHIVPTPDLMTPEVEAALRDAQP
jgi:hypothetical protein